MSETTGETQDDAERVAKLRSELLDIAALEAACKKRRATVERELRKMDLRPRVDEWARILAMPDSRGRA